jgi:hypothetical protein
MGQVMEFILGQVYGVSTRTQRDKSGTRGWGGGGGSWAKNGAPFIIIFTAIYHI